METTKRDLGISLDLLVDPPLCGIVTGIPLGDEFSVLYHAKELSSRTFGKNRNVSLPAVCSADIVAQLWDDLGDLPVKSRRETLL